MGLCRLILLTTIFLQSIFSKDLDVRIICLGAGWLLEMLSGFSMNHLLCSVSMGRSEEKCLVRSGLVQLMDRLCSLSSQTESSSSEKQTKKQKVATMAWAAFQVLANRCVEWEKEEGREGTLSSIK